MTEQEAKQKWCPMVRYMNFEGGIINNRGQYLVGSFPNTMECIASDCMMWRWSMLPDGEPEYAAKAIGGGHFENAPCGYCGLTNKP